MSAILNNYYELASAAREAGNNAQCEQYCNRILEVNAEHAPAWALKGAAAGWQSSISSPRIEEMMVCYSNAIQYAQEPELVEQLKAMADDELKEVTLALFSLQCDRFQKWPDADEATAFLKLYFIFLNTGKNFMLRSKMSLTCLGQIREQLATMLNNCAVDVEKGIRSEYANSNGGFPDDFDLQKLINQEGNCLKVMEASVTIGEDDENNIVRWKNMINNHEYCINARSYQRQYSEYSGWKYYVHKSLTADAVDSRRRDIDGLQRKIREAQSRMERAKEKARQEKIRKYWEAHAEEQQKLVEEQRALTKEQDQLETEKRNIDTSEDITRIKGEINELEAKRQGLGVFALKEKKNIDSQLTAKRASRDKILATLKEPIDERLKQIQERKTWIEDELTRDR